MRNENQNRKPIRQFQDETTLLQYIDGNKGLHLVSETAISDQQSEVEQFNNGEIRIDAENQALVARIGNTLFRTGLVSSEILPITSVFRRGGAVAARSGDYTFAQIGGKPTTLAGYGIADAQSLIPHGVAVLEANGTKTVDNVNVTTADRIFLNRGSGNSNMAIYVNAVVAGVSFTITSLGGEMDAGLNIGWLIL